MYDIPSTILSNQSMDLIWNLIYSKNYLKLFIIFSFLYGVYFKKKYTAARGPQLLITSDIRVRGPRREATQTSESGLIFLA